jgi:hypothetical protein
MGSGRLTGYGRQGFLLVLAVALAAGVMLADGAAQAAPDAGRGAPTAGILTTVAGGVGGPAPATQVSVAPCGTANLTTACGVTFAAGNLYFTDIGATAENQNQAGSDVREVSISTGRLTTPAGLGFRLAPLGDGGPATEAVVNMPGGVAVDSARNLLIADTDDSLIRVVAASSATFYGQKMTAGDIYTIAGNGTPGFSGDRGTAVLAELDLPTDVAVDHSGSVVICDGDGRLRVVAATTGTFYGQKMTAGDIYTVAGGGTLSANGVPATNAAIAPAGVAVDAAGALVFPDGTKVRVVPVKTGTFYGQPMKAGDVYTAAGGGISVRNGVPAVTASIDPTRTAVDAAGNLVIADFSNGKVRVVAAKTGAFYGLKMKAHDIYTVAGGGTSLSNGALALRAKLRHPRAVAVDSAGNIVIAAGLSHRVVVVAAATGTFYGQKMTAGHIYVIAGNGKIWSSGDGGPALHAQFFASFLGFSPSVLGIDAGNLVVNASTLTRAGVNTELKLIPATAGAFFGQPMKAGDIYWIAGNDIEGFSGDGGPATKAELNAPDGTAGGPSGNLLVADGGNSRVRVVANRSGTFYGQKMKTGDIYTVAGDGNSSFSGDGGPAIKAGVSPSDVAADPAGNLLIADVNNNRVRVVADKSGTFYGQKMTAGDIYTVAGGGTSSLDGVPATSALLAGPGSLAADGAGDLVLNEGTLLRMVPAKNGTFYGVHMIAGDIYTIAGNGTSGTTGDGGPARSAEITNSSMAMAGTGNVVLADPDGARIRVVAARTGTFYGVPMIAGDIYIIGGMGVNGFSNDGTVATQAKFGFIDGVAVFGSDVVFYDLSNVRVRAITG